MDPDSIFIILLYLIFLVLALKSIFSLSIKLWATAIPTIVKLLIIALMIAGIIIGVYSLVNVTGDNMYVMDIVFYSVSFVIGLNWSINLARKYVQRIKNNFTLPVILVLSIGFTFLLLHAGLLLSLLIVPLRN